jgi:hypothetical protein
MAFIEQIVGAVVMAVTLLDIFLTVLYARARAVSRWIWLEFRLVAGPFTAIAAESCRSAARSFWWR